MADSIWLCKLWVSPLVHDAIQYILRLPLKAPSKIISFFTHVQLCLATATHDFKWVKITQIICLILEQTFINPDV